MIEPERDPKVFWYEPGKHWVMILYGDGQYKIFTSHNLLEWKDEHKPIPDSFECPDFFELPLDGDPHNKKWVLIQGSGQYSVGTFDGRKFTEETKRFPCDVGPNFYATQSWANTDTGDGRRIQTAWMRGGSFPDMPFNQQISFPCELKLRSTPAGPRISREPIMEIASLHNGKKEWHNLELKDGQTLTLEPDGDLFQIKAEVDIPAGASLKFKANGADVVLTHDELHNGDKGHVEGGAKSIEILVDRTSIEAFVNRGEVSSTRSILPKGAGITLAASGSVTVKSMHVYRLKSIWPSSSRH
jgi:levanase/fructan beta-fructosidase